MDLQQQDLKSSPRSNRKSSASVCSNDTPPNGGLTQLSLPMFDVSDSQVSQGLSQETLQPYSVASPASHTQLLVSDLARKMIATYGRSSGVLLANFDHELSCWKMCQASLPGMLFTSLVTLPRWGTTVDGELYEQPTPVRHTNGNAGSAWPSPKAIEPNERIETWTARRHRCNMMGPALSTAIQMLWATPTARDHSGGTYASEQNRNSPHLSSLCKLWATPKARDYRSGGTDPQKTRDRVINRKRGELTIDLPEQVIHQATTELETGLLNPEWVEQLMGFPPGWTNPDGQPVKGIINTSGKHRAPLARVSTRIALLKSKHSATLSSHKSPMRLRVNSRSF